MKVGFYPAWLVIGSGNERYTPPEHGGWRKFMVAIATAIFIALLFYGWDFLGWGRLANDDVQVGLFMAFVLGIVAGYKVRP